MPDERLYRFLNDYKLNLISPADMGEGEFEKFHTDLGLAMKVIKHQNIAYILSYINLYL